MGGPRAEGVPDSGVPRGSLDDVRDLRLRYSSARPQKIEFAVVYVGGRVKVFEVDRFLIEHLEHSEA